MMKLVNKAFEELSVTELYKIYALRCAVFVVEQNCPYQDIDEYDLYSRHLWLEEDGELLAYLRILPPGCTFQTASLGRVIAKVRRKGYATTLLKEAIKEIKERYDSDYITIEAQTYALSLYEKQGFSKCSEEFLEDGIPHYRMQLKISAD